MFIIAKTLQGQEFMYSKKSTILCRSKKQAEKLADFLNNHNETVNENWKLKEKELWWVYEIDKFDSPPAYKLKTTSGKIVIVENDVSLW